MSGLAGLLAHHHAPGVYTWHSHLHVPDVQHSVEHAGWRFVFLDGIAVESRDEFLSSIGKVLDFPDYYGRNFDAVADLLRGVQGSDSEHGVILLWEAWGSLARADKKAFNLAINVLAERANNLPDAPFAVLLRGEGPDLPDLKSLD